MEILSIIQDCTFYERCRCGKDYKGKAQNDEINDRNGKILRDFYYTVFYHYFQEQ